MIEVDIPAVAAVVDITHAGRSNFVVVTYTAQAERLDLLVNEIGRYEGRRPIQFLEGEEVGIFEITANGNWEITVRPLEEAGFSSCSAQPFQGHGDDVVIFEDFQSSGGIADLTHDGESNFVVIAWGVDRDLLVNEIGTYDGTVLVGQGLFVWEIVADGNWTVSC